jgi:hypothetical protein
MNSIKSKQICVFKERGWFESPLIHLPSVDYYFGIVEVFSSNIANKAATKLGTIFKRGFAKVLILFEP